MGWSAAEARYLYFEAVGERLKFQGETPIGSRYTDVPERETPDFSTGFIREYRENVEKHDVFLLETSTAETLLETVLLETVYISSII